MARTYLLASDFDQTLSFNDSGVVLSDLLGISGFREKARGLSALNLVQQGGELAYLLRHDPESRRVRAEHLVEVGRRVRLKRNVGRLAQVLSHDIDGHRFDFYVISAAPQEVVVSALRDWVPSDHIIATRFAYSAITGEIESIVHVPAGFGKVAAIDSLQTHLGIPPERVIYVGDGDSDLHVMLHVNRREGYTISVSESRALAPVARRTVLSDDAISVLVPVFEEIVGLGAGQIREVFEGQGLLIQEWEKVRADWVTIRERTG